ncbi:MAG: hypothetical protein ACRDMX_07810, partial [Solirubrobacteraceae bacterium]
ARRWRVAVPALASLLVLAAVALGSSSAPRHAVAAWFKAALGLSAQPAASPTLGPLPSGGQLLARAPSGLWLVRADGHRRLLGRWTDGVVSPHSLYLAAWRGDELAALDLRGRPQWVVSNANAGPVSGARWSPDGYRIAYLAGSTLMVIAGDSSDRRALATSVDPVAPAWEPGTGAHRVAFVDGRGEVELRDADTGALIWRARTPAPPRQLLWAAGGGRLIAICGDEIVAYGRNGARTGERAAGGPISAAALSPAGGLALIVDHPAVQTVSVVLAPDRSGRAAAPQALFTAAETLADPAFSPDGRWLVVASPSADEWLWLRVAGALRIGAVSGVAAKFHAGTASRGFPAPADWQPINPQAPRS